MRSLGLPVDSAMRVDDDTTVTVHMTSSGPELLIYTPYRFGGDQATAWLADDAHIGESGSIGSGTSLGPFNDARREYEFFYCYVFGAGQGPVRDIVLSDSEARWQLTKPEINGWVIVLTDEADVSALEWEIVGIEDTTLHAGRGFPGNYTCGAGE
jgi:hypothetical protein